MSMYSNKLYLYYFKVKVSFLEIVKEPIEVEGYSIRGELGDYRQFIRGHSNVFSQNFKKEHNLKQIKNISFMEKNDIFDLFKSTWKKDLLSFDFIELHIVKKIKPILLRIL